MLVSAIPLMEQDNEIRSRLYKLAQEQFGEGEKPVVTERKGNVLKVNFK